MKLYGVRGWGSGIAEAMLRLADLEYEFIDVDGFDQPGPARDKLSAINPLAQVPALVVSDTLIVTETAAIALLLVDRAPHLAPPLYSDERARFYRLLAWLVANVYPTFTYGDYPERWTPSAPGELVSATDRYRENLYRWFDTQVAGPYVFGDAPSVLDPYIAAMVNWRPRRKWFEQHCPALAAIAERTRRLDVLAPVMQANGWS